jgi:NAD(P)-dependent dehydrogenase (short-subunit alcohol dehydrogenase family)
MCPLLTTERPTMYTPFDLDGRTAVITGGNGGIGYGMAEALLAAGASVAIWGSRPEKTETARVALATACGDASRVHAFVCDVGDEAQVQACFADTVAALGHVDACFANAGVSSKGTTILDMSLDEFRRVQRINVEGVFLTFRAAARHMVERGAGTILFTGATASLRGGSGFVNLAAPKFGLRAVAQSMARELGPKGIHVAHVIIDGQIHSERYAHLAAERGPDSLLEPDAIAAQYLALHRQHRSAWTQELDLRPWSEKF